ncbi:MAG: GNAT family N-acetyltransferase [Lentisphaeria bacterium]
MQMKIRRFALSHFQELIPLLLRCFPDFWEPRLAREQFSFPYDLKLFAGCLNGRPLACIGIHDYQIIMDGRVLPLGGLCDVCVDPDFRGLGFAYQLQDYVLHYCLAKTEYRAMPLYTDKPGVYRSRGWQQYEGKRSREISLADFPPLNTFSLAGSSLDLRKIWRTGGDTLRPAEKIAREITSIYQAGRVFDGKCLRSAKVWNELFAEPLHCWRLDKNTYFLYRGERLLEAYSRDESHPVNHFFPLQETPDGHQVMINILHSEDAAQNSLSAAIAAQQLVFPAADVF